MLLKFGKCVVMHIGKRNPCNTYTIRKPNDTRVELQSLEGVKDLSVKADNELAFSEHIRFSTGKAICVIAADVF